MHQKWNRLVAGVSLAAVLLCGCGKEPVPTVLPEDPTAAPTQSATPTQPPVTEPPVTQPPVTEPPVTEPPISMGEAVKKLTCTKWRTYPQLQDLGGGMLLATRNQYSTDHKQVVCTVEILDLLNDAVLADTILMHTAQPMGQRFDDGAVVLRVPSDGILQVYDSALQLKQTIESGNTEGYFSRDRKSYYYAENGMLWRMDTASGNSGAMALNQPLRVDRLMGVHPRQNLLVARVYLSCYGRACGIAVIDATTGTVKLLTDRLDALQLWDGGFCGMGYDEEIYGNDVHVGGFGQETVTLFDASELADYEVSCSLVASSPYLLRKCYTEGAEAVWLYDLEAGAVIPMDVYGVKTLAGGAVYLSGAQLIAGFYEDGLDFYPVVMDPKEMHFSPALTAQEGAWGALIDETIIENVKNELAGPALPASLAAVRQQADELEKTYGVHILLGAQAQAPCAHSDFAVTLCEDASVIAGALDTLKAELAKYPQGFLKQLRGGVPEDGLYFCLTGAIAGGVDTVGFARPSGGRYELALDITDGKVAKTLHHEIWHAIEMHCSVETFDAGWAGYNPVGFAYYGRYDQGYTDLTRWTYSGGTGADSYFVDAYSRINSREDRAQIFACAMAGDAAVFTAPAIKAKLLRMDNLLRQNFSSGSWTEVWWQQFL